MASWDKNFFKKDTKDIVDHTRKFQNLGQGEEKNFEWDYFNPIDGKLGYREMKFNRNLLNPKEFANYWQTGKHKNHEIYSAGDLNGDGIRDFLAVDPSNKVVGYNERYITDEGKGETPYRFDYYQKSKEERDKLGYTEYLDTAEPIEGWKDISKIKENRKNSAWKIIDDHLDVQFKSAGATIKQREVIAKRLLKLIAETFFASSKADAVPSYQVKVITESPEFKKILKSSVTKSTIATYLPLNARSEIVTGMMQLIQGYGSTIISTLRNWLRQNVNTNRISSQQASKLYTSIIIKQAANKLYKQYGLTAAEAANNPQLFEQYKQALLVEQNKLAEKYAKQQYDIN